MKMKNIAALVLAMCMIVPMSACGKGSAGTQSGGSNNTAASDTSGGAADAADTGGADTAAAGQGFNATGFPIMNEMITLSAWNEGGATTDWDNNQFIKRKAELTNINLKIIATSDADATQKRNIMFASGDYPDMLLTNWNAMITKTDTMQYAVKEGIIIPITDYIEKYGNNMKRVFDAEPNYRAASTAPDGEIYGVPRFSECYHCSAYPKVYYRQDWLDDLGLQMPTTTEELREVLRAFVNNDPNGNGQKDEIGMIGATKWNTMLEYALMGMSFQTVKPDFWLSLADDGESIEFSPWTDSYREGLRYIKSLYDEGLIDGTSFTQDSDQMAQTVRTEPYAVGMYVCDHAGMGYDNNNPEEAENYQILLPVAGPTGFRRQGQNAFEGEVRGYHAVITDVCEYPEAAYRYIDEIFLDDDTNMERMYGERGFGWDYAPEGTKNVFGDDARYVTLPLSAEQKVDNELNTYGNGPQADLAPFRLSMLPEVDNVYLPENYEQRITLDTKPLEQFLPAKRLMYTVFTPLDMMDEYSEIQANLNSYVRMATVQFIMGERDIESGWDQYINELKSYKVERYIEIYKASLEQ